MACGADSFASFVEKESGVFGIPSAASRRVNRSSKAAALESRPLADCDGRAAVMAFVDVDCNG